MKIIVLLISLLIFQFSYSQDCEPLENGKYKLIPNKQFEIYPEYIFKIKNGKLISIDLKTHKRQKFTIQTNRDCSLSFYSTGLTPY